MRPETRVLLTLEPMSAIMARVTYRLIQLDYAHNHGLYATPIDGLVYLSSRLQRDGFAGLSLWVSAYAFHKRKGVSCAAYKQRLVRRARWAALNRAGGKPWARVPPR
jgi:hypothetical protein